MISGKYLYRLSSLRQCWSGRSSPGNIIRRTSRDAGFNGVCAVHAHRVEGLVVAEPKGIQIDVGLGRCPGGRLTWNITAQKDSTVSAVADISRYSHAQLPNCIISSGTAVCTGGFEFGSKCPATVKVLRVQAIKLSSQTLQASVCFFENIFRESKDVLRCSGRNDDNTNSSEAEKRDDNCGENLIPSSSRSRPAHLMS